MRKCTAKKTRNIKADLKTKKAIYELPKPTRRVGFLLHEKEVLMAKDDYDVVVFRVLAYLYAVFKRKIVFEKLTFDPSVSKGLSDEYFKNVFRLITEEELIEGLSFVRVWGSQYILANSLDEMSIISKGIHYLKENDRMEKAKEAILRGADRRGRGL